MTLRLASEVKKWRDEKRNSGLCTSCGKRPVFKKVNEGFLKVYSKCSLCLKRAAWFQAEYREKKHVDK